MFAHLESLHIYTKVVQHCHDWYNNLCRLFSCFPNDYVKRLKIRSTFALLHDDVLLHAFELLIGHEIFLLLLYASILLCFLLLLGVLHLPSKLKNNGKQHVIKAWFSVDIQDFRDLVNDIKIIIIYSLYLETIIDSQWSQSYFRLLNLIWNMII